MDSPKFVELGNGRLSFEETGSGETIVLIHGFSLNHSMWKDQVELLKEKYHVLTYDMRGFGKSSSPDLPYSHHEDLKTLLDFLDISKTHLVGLSLGGEVAIDFTLTYQDLVYSLTLVDSSIGGYKSTVDWNVHPEQGLNKAKENWLNHEVFAQTQKNEEAFKLLTKIATDYSGWHWFNKDPRKKLSPSVLEQLEKIKVITQAITGEQDLSYYQEMANTLGSKIKNSQKVTIPSSGHLPNIENSNIFNRVLLDFLSRYD